MRARGRRSFEGTVTSGNGSLYLHPTSQRERFERTCDPSSNSDRSVASTDFDLHHELGATPGAGVPTLRLSNASRGFDMLFVLQSR